MINNIKQDQPEREGFLLYQLQERYGFSVSYWRKEIRAGRLKAKLVRGRVVVFRGELDDYFSREAKDWTPKSERSLATAV